MVLSPPSGPQRQSRLSVGRLLAAPGSPASGRPPSTLGLGQSEQGGGQGAGWAGGGRGAAQVWRLRLSLPPRVPGLALGFWMSGTSVCIGSQKARSSLNPAPRDGRMFGKQKAKIKGVSPTKEMLTGSPWSPETLPYLLLPQACGPALASSQGGQSAQARAQGGRGS